jgi:hypothetical protein
MFVRRRKVIFLDRNIYDMWPASKTEFAYFCFKTKIGAA